MKRHFVAGCILLTLAATSCGGGRKAVELDPSSPVIATRWNGTLATPSALLGVVDLQASAWMGQDPKDGDKTVVHVDVRNAVPGAVHAWHVHRGQCGSDQGIFGPQDAYKPLKVGDNGRAISDAKLPVPTPKTGDYFVNVHASARNMRTIVACGNLAPPAR
jgi:hypothetical protein